MLYVRFLAMVFGTICLLCPTSAHARKVFLNGVDMDKVDLPRVSLRNCDVVIDAKGNVHITASGYKIRVEGSGGGSSGTVTPRRVPTSVPAVGSASENYYLVSFFNKKEATQYDIEVFINKNMIRRIRARSDQVATDITRFIKRGKVNEIIFVARKNYGSKGRISQSPLDYFRVVIGAGFESKGQIVLKRSLVEMRRTAAESNTTYTRKYVRVFR